MGSWIALLTLVASCSSAVATAIHDRHAPLLERATTGKPLLQQFDQVFCSISYHSAIFVNGQLIVNNGELDFNYSSQGWIPESFRDVWVLDMSQSWTTTTGPLLITNASHTSTIDLPPSRNCYTANWLNGSNIAVFGGERGDVNTDDLLPAQIYQYDIASASWSVAIPSTDNKGNLAPRSCGSYVQAGNIGYYIGGYDGPLEDQSLQATYMSPDMLQVDLTNGTLSTIDTSNFTTQGYGTTVSGSLNYIESIGKQGILVAFGGISYAPSTEFSWSTPPAYDNYLDMSNISVYDIASQQWYMQSASSAASAGVDVRVQFCSVIVSAPDNSSHNIYIYGGYNTYYTYNTVQVLSIPSFTWTTAYANTAGTSRFVQSCNVIGNSQMVVMGGVQHNITANGEQTGTMNCNSADVFQVFDLTTHKWVDSFTPNDAAYGVNADIVATIGGSSTGGAKVTSPADGWTDPALEAIFKNEVTTSSTTTTSSSSSTATPTLSTSPSTPPKKKSNAGAIAGGVIGGILGLLAIAAVLFLWRRERSRNRREDAPMPPQASRPHEVIQVMKPPLYGGDMGHYSELQGVQKDSAVEMSADRQAAELAGQHVNQHTGPIAELPSPAVQ